MVRPIEPLAVHERRERLVADLKLGAFWRQRMKDSAPLTDCHDGLTRLARVRVIAFYFTTALLYRLHSTLLF